LLLKEKEVAKAKRTAESDEKMPPSLMVVHAAPGTLLEIDAPHGLNRALLGAIANETELPSQIERALRMLHRVDNYGVDDGIYLRETRQKLATQLMPLIQNYPTVMWIHMMLIIIDDVLDALVPHEDDE
jgi:hypothetical protein